MTIEEEYLISEYMGWNFEDTKYWVSWERIFEVADIIEEQEGYTLVMHHNTFLFKNLATEGYAPAQAYHQEPAKRIGAAHECLVKMIKYINTLKKGEI